MFCRGDYSRDKAAALVEKLSDTPSYIRKHPGRYWGYAYLRSRSEKSTAETLTAAGIPCYLPLLPKARLHHGSKVVTQLPMLPGYLFLAADEMERSELKRTQKHIVQIELQREAARENTLISELNTLRRFELLAQTEKVLINPGLRQGDVVQITDGPLKGLQTIVVRRDDDNDSIIVNLTMLDHSLEYPVSAGLLQKITG